MKRGEIWTVSGAGYPREPRPAVIVQDDRFDASASVTICVLTTNHIDAPLFRLAVAPGDQNGLRSALWLMADKLTTVPRQRLGNRIGVLGGEDMLRLNRAILVFLGLA